MTKKIKRFADDDMGKFAAHKDGCSSLDRHLYFERIVNRKIADGDFDGIMRIVDEEGSFPVVTMLSEEPMSTLEEWVDAIGGRANVFIADGDRISYMAVEG